MFIVLIILFFHVNLYIYQKVLFRNGTFVTVYELISPYARLYINNTNFYPFTSHVLIFHFVQLIVICI